MSKANLQVLKGRGREEVGTIEAQVGLMTNRGVINRVTPGGTVFLEDGTQVRNPAGTLTVNYTEAKKRGFVVAPEPATV